MGIVNLRWGRRYSNCSTSATEVISLNRAINIRSSLSAFKRWNVWLSVSFKGWVKMPWDNPSSVPSAELTSLRSLPAGSFTSSVDFLGAAGMTVGIISYRPRTAWKLNKLCTGQGVHSPQVAPGRTIHVIGRFSRRCRYDSWNNQLSTKNSPRAKQINGLLSEHTFTHFFPSRHTRQRVRSTRATLDRTNLDITGRFATGRCRYDSWNNQLSTKS